MTPISEADLILNPDGTVYHLNLLPEDIADTIITVGDQDRVSAISKYFDKIELKKGKREFITHTGYLGKKRISVLSTGIGTDNIDIVINELDALVNIDFKNRLLKDKLKSLDIIRIGTSGSIREDIGVGSILASSHGLGLDALMTFYESEHSLEDQHLLQKIKQKLPEGLNQLYLNSASSKLVQRIAFDLPTGITATAPGFYAPQGRKVRAKNAFSNWIEILASFEYKHQRITNLEMETAGIYALANVLGHHALSINAILAHRFKLEFAKNPEKIVENAIKLVLDRI